ncbi:MAG: sugar phosphate isomerase/epimerase [Phycisphaerales bacterium]
MSRPITIVTGQWGDVPLEKLARMMSEFGYEGLELGAGHFDVTRGAKDQKYCDAIRALLDKHRLTVWAISGHVVGQQVCDPNDCRSDAFALPELAGKPDEKRKWAVATMKDAARAAKNLGVQIVTGFVGSSIWHLIYSWPPVPEQMIEEGFRYFARMWNPILDVFDECGVRFALEVHPTEIAFDAITTKRAMDAVGNREAFGINLDPSHLQWQMVDPARFIQEFPNRIYHVHVKDVAVQLTGRNSILGSHLNFGSAERGWDFRSPGHGDVDFEAIIRALNQIHYQGPLSVEWEDSGMDREFGAREAFEFVRKLNFSPSSIAFDANF